MRSGPPGLALFALLAIVMITVAWWMLALWPAGAEAPVWLLRTRAACFGAAPGGLPDAGGWVLLIGEPIGMLAVLVSVWGRPLWSDIRRVVAQPVGRVLTGVVLAGAVAAMTLVLLRASRAYGSLRQSTEQALGVTTPLDHQAPLGALVDQHGRRVTFADFRGTPVLITFAFGHCTTVCPTLVHDVLSARRAAGRHDVRLTVVTVDPWRDTPDRLASIAERWDLGPDDRVLSGGEGEVGAMLDALGIGRSRDARTGDIAHPGTVMMLDERGVLAWRLDGGWGRVGELLLRR